MFREGNDVIEFTYDKRKARFYSREDDQQSHLSVMEEFSRIEGLPRSDSQR